MNTRQTIFARRGRASGFTLIESVMSVVIVSGVLVSALGTLGAIGRARQTQVDRAAATLLADRMLAEVAQCYFQEPGTTLGNVLGTESGETARSGYDDVDDYDNLELQPPTLRDGTAMTGYAGWKVKVRVEHVQISDPTNPVNTYTGLKRIKVTATTPTGATVDVSTLRGVDGVYEQLPTSTTNYLTYTGITARNGDNGRTVHGGARPLNVTTSQ